MIRLTIPDVKEADKSDQKIKSLSSKATLVEDVGVQARPLRGRFAQPLWGVGHGQGMLVILLSPK